MESSLESPEASVSCSKADEPNSSAEQSQSNETKADQASILKIWKSDATPLSKNAQKKEAKYQRAIANRTEKRRDEKKRKRERKTADKLEREKKQAKIMETLSPEEKAVQEKQALDMPRMLKSKARKARTRELMERAPKIVIDMNFEEKMNSKEILSLSQQTRLCYGLNTRSENPLHMCLTSVNKARSALFAHMSKNSGFEDWPIMITEDNFLSLCPREKIVYLTAESDQVLESVQPDCVYVIGGIVDHNRFKSIAHDRAKELGLTTRRLPLESHLADGLRKVITVNQVFHIVLGFWESGKWDEAVHKALPPRWQKTPSSSSSPSSSLSTTSLTSSF